ncbi:MAG: riboflavin synthase [Desulfovibrionaceae bacterium]|jgi:riboflavin synthase|nr:riboflavin synthase [Desulfovibrionaceae bacterium]
MFTGLIQAMGRVASLEARGGQTRLRVGLLAPLAGERALVGGESIAVNGACLTVETFGPDWFSAYASSETMSRTNLGALSAGAVVNLERALALGERLGGHLVSGHVDCAAQVALCEKAGESTRFRFTFPAEYGPQVIAKGSVALDGVSLTVNNCGSDFLEVNVIPATQRETTIGGWQPGYRANMETDMIGKYVQRMLAPWTGSTSGEGRAAAEPASPITEDFLRRHGF